MFGASSEQGRGPRAPRDQGFSRQRVEIPDQVGQPSLKSLRAGRGGALSLVFWEDEAREIGDQLVWEFGGGREDPCAKNLCIASTSGAGMHVSSCLVAARLFH